MKYSIRTILLATLLTAISVWGVQRRLEYQRIWSKMTRNSAPIISLKTDTPPISTFKYFDTANEKFVDLRHEADHIGWASFWTFWRVPYTEEALRSHIEHFSLIRIHPDPTITQELKNYLPDDWSFPANPNVHFFIHPDQENPPWYCRVVACDRRQGIIYFYNKNRDDGGPSRPSWFRLD